eukprot:UN08571
MTQPRQRCFIGRCNNSRGNNQPTEYDMCVEPLLLFMRVKLLFFFDRNKSPANFLFKEQNRGANFSQNEVISLYSSKIRNKNIMFNGFCKTKFRFNR